MCACIRERESQKTLPILCSVWLFSYAPSPSLFPQEGVLEDHSLFLSSYAEILCNDSFTQGTRLLEA